MPHPNSFLKLILLGFSLVALPLLAALAYAGFYVDRLSDQSRHAVYQAVRATQGSRKLVEEVIAMERTASQFQILGDRTLFHSYEETHNKFRQTGADLAQLPLGPPVREKLADLVQKEEQVYKTFQHNAHDSEASKAAVTRFIELSELARGVLAGSNLVIDREVEVMRDIADRAQTFFVWLGLASVPAAVFVAAGFAILIARPIRQIEQAILQLGRGAFTNTIRVSGPQDLVYLGERLDWLRLRLAEVDAEKVKFLRHVSHELKTPLSSIHEGSELLADGVVGPLRPEQREVAEILRANTEQLQKLIENLLNFSMAHVRQPVLRREAVSLSQLMEEVIADQRLSVIAKELQLTTELAPLKVSADRDKIRVVFDNLLSNAVKYSPRHGSVAIAIRPSLTGAVVEISDSGPGVPAHEKEKVFEAFYQGQVLTEGHIKGSGLGLAIVREYVEGHGWRVEVAETQGPGARLCIHIPIKHVEETA